MTPDFTHIDSDGKAHMVNVGHKVEQRRRAIATGKLVCLPETIQALKANALPKGDVLTVAQVAGILGAKKAGQLIPLCHPLGLDCVEVSFKVCESSIEILCTAETCARTGVEMEALTGVSISALTLYDMCKSVDKSMRIEDIRLVKKEKK